MPSRQANLVDPERLPARGAVPRDTVDGDLWLRTRVIPHATDAPPAGGGSAGKVATSAWSSPPPSTHCRTSASTTAPAAATASRSAASRSSEMSTETSDAEAMCPRSASNPSETSVIDVAPVRAATSPCPYGGCGTRCRRRSSSNCSIPLRHNSYPACERPGSPISAMTSPGRAPLRRTGARPPRSPSAVTDTTHCGPDTRSPPTMPAPNRSASCHMPSATSTACAVSVCPGAAKPTTNAVARPPIASMSAAFWAMALRPTSWGDDQSRRKWRSSTSMSVLTTVRPSGQAMTAASSPGPSGTHGGWRRPATNRSMTANSPDSASVAPRPSPVICGFLSSPGHCRVP